MTNVFLHLRLGNDALYKRFELPSVPRVGEQVSLWEGSFVFEVERVTYELQSGRDEVVIDGSCDQDCVRQEWRDSLTKDGWEVDENAFE